ncbi:hypothetical protein [Salinispora arenicola]|uniref:hypothetical protein n=1 Tax=Salinispora arenicola TaxID=168697 RepID=UPI00036A9E7E|nr:hypothetical protein [Salinispora arenicola]MCN0154946.1 hypothetical protein [Salinispora arenicola]NIL43585.1 hypothetical protein [Salinispora arenicola]
MNERELTRRCERVVRDLDFPQPFTIDEFCSRLGQRRGRPIQLVPQRFPPQGPCGALVATVQMDVIFFQVGTSVSHQNHIVAHEIGHLVCGHPAQSLLDDIDLQLFLPAINPRLIRHMLARAGYDETAEREAEIFASLVTRRASTSRWTPPSDAPPLKRIARSLAARRT